VICAKKFAILNYSTLNFLAQSLKLTKTIYLNQLLFFLGFALLAICCFVLVEPFSVYFFSIDGETLEPRVRDFLVWVRLTTAIMGLLLALLGLRIRERSLPQGGVILLTLSIIFSLVFVDIVARIMALRKWGSAFATPLPINTARKEGESALTPGVYASQVSSDYDPSYRDRVFFTINQFGLRGHLPKVPKPVETFRIIALGGSSTFGYSVTDGLDWPSQLEKKLKPHGPFEVINAARPGATTSINYPYLRDRLLRLEPNLFVFHEGFNDFWRAVKNHDRDWDRYSAVDETLPARESPLELSEANKWPARPLFLTYYFGEWLNRRLKRLERPSRDELEKLLAYDPAIVSIYRRNLQAMVRLSKSKGAQVVLTTFAACDDPSLPESEQRLRLKYTLHVMPELELKTAQHGMDLYRQITREVADLENVPLIDLAKLLPKDTRLFTDTIHFTPAGEEHVSRILAAELTKWLPRKVAKKD